MIKKTNNIPKIRFLEFNDEWALNKLSEVMTESRLGGNYENSESNSGHPVIKMGNLGRGEINLDKIQYLPYDEPYSDEDILKEGDLLFNTRNTLDLVGKVSIWRNELPFALYNSNIMRMKFNKSIESSNRFMNYLFNNENSIKQLRRYATGTTSVAAIYGKDLQNLKFNIPSLPEQQKIASFLTTVDEKLQALKKKKTLLEQYKKGVMHKIFSQEIRFRDDNGNDYPEWEEKNLGEIYDITSSKRVFQSEWTNSGVPFYRAREIVKLCNAGYVNNELYISEEMYEKYKLEFGAPKYNDLLVTAVGTLGRLYVVKESDRFYFKDGNIIWFKNIDLANSQYVKQLFQTKIIKKQIEDNASITTVGTYTIEFAKKTRIPFPCKEEQTKIANFFSAIDDKINHCQTQIDKTEMWKKGLLQRMFC